MKLLISSIIVIVLVLLGLLATSQGASVVSRQRNVRDAENDWDESDIDGLGVHQIIINRLPRIGTLEKILSVLRRREKLDNIESHLQQQSQSQGLESWPEGYHVKRDDIRSRLSTRGGPDDHRCTTDPWCLLFSH